MRYVSLSDAAAYYKTSTSAVTKRARKGTLATMVENNTRYYAIELSEEDKDNKKHILAPLPKAIEHKPPKPPVQKKITNPLADPSRLKKIIEERYEITKDTEVLIDDFCTHYRYYITIRDMAYEEPLTEFGKLNPLFTLVKDEFARIKELARMIGIGQLFSQGIMSEPKVVANPFEAFI